MGRDERRDVSNYRATLTERAMRLSAAPDISLREDMALAAIHAARTCRSQGRAEYATWAQGAVCAFGASKDEQDRARMLGALCIVAPEDLSLRWHGALPESVRIAVEGGAR